MTAAAGDCQPTDIAVIGYAGRFPGASSVASLWDLLLSDRSARRTPERTAVAAAGIARALLDNPAYVNAVYGIDDSDCFDAHFFGYTPREAKAIDPQHRVLLECGWNALEHAGYATDRPLNVGVYAGCSLNTYILNTGQAQHFVSDPVFTLMSSDKDFLATRLAFKLKLEGPAVTVQSACSTSLVAVHVACQALLGNECDIALAGGSCIKVPLDAGYLYRAGGILSPDGECRPFDAAAGGTVFGSGVALVVLKRLERALADGDTVHAVIKATAINNDGGRKSSYTAPSVDGIADVIRQALDFAGLSADAIGYVECHGTGTALGDPVEVQAMVRAFVGFTRHEGYCAIGSVKGHIGHLEAAAGIAGLIKAIVCLEHRHLPATLHFNTPNPSLPLAGSPFAVNAVARPWDDEDQPRVALVNSLGVGGTNAAVIVREAAAPARHASASSWHILPVSGKTSGQRDALRDAVGAAIGDDPAMVADAAFTLAAGRAPLPFRTALLAGPPAAAIATIDGPAKGVSREPILVFVGEGQDDERFWTRLGVNPSARLAEGSTQTDLRSFLDRTPVAVFLALSASATATMLAEMIAGSTSHIMVAADTDTSGGPPIRLRRAATLWCAGIEIDLARLYEGETRHRIPLPVTSFTRERHWW